MNKGILYIILICMTAPTYAATTTSILKPSLTLQMNKNAQLVKENIKNEKLSAIQQKIQENKARLSAKKTQKTTASNTPVTPTLPLYTAANTLQSSLTPKVSPSISSGKMHESSSVSGVDMDQVRNAWLSWTNTVRKDLSLPLYSIENRLNETALEWSQFSKQRGYIIHGRPGDGCEGVGNYTCYNFSAIDTWFKARGIDPTVINRTKHTENIGTRGYRCSHSDCTYEMIQAIRLTFDYFLSEKSYNGVHYRSLVSPYLSKIGIGITTDETKGVYYLTVHYITQ